MANPMLDVISLHVYNKGLDMATVEEPALDPSYVAYSTIHIKVSRTICEDVYREYRQFLIKRYHSPATLMLGWKTWVQLSYGMSGFEDCGGRITEWRGLPVLVDDTTSELVKFLPKVRDVIMGGCDFAG